MTAASAPVRATSRPAPRRPGLAAARLMRVELRHNAMLWMVPVAIAVFWFISYRKIMVTPALWNLRANAFQSGVVADFIVPVIGAAAWMGSRESRRHLTDLMAISARPRWARLLAAWAATTTWALVGYLICLAVVYGATAHQARWGGPLWWPAVVAAASLVAYSALGFAAGSLLPSRFTAPVVAVASFFLLVLSTELISGGQSYWQISPVVAGPWEDGGDAGVATFYRYVPDLSIAQVIFLVGLTAAVLGALALAGSGRHVRAAAAGIAAAGVLAAGSGVALAGTGMLDRQGMITIPALHDAASDRPIRFTPVCSSTAIPICVNPAYASYLHGVTAALAPVLREIAGLPGAPVRISQAPATYQQGPGNSIAVQLAGRRQSGGAYRILLPDQIPAPPLTISQLASQVRTATGPGIIASLVGDGPGASQAQHAIAAALAIDAGLPPTNAEAAASPVPRGRFVHSRRQSCTERTSADCSSGRTGAVAVRNSVYAAAQRFAALSSAARRSWLAQHLTALRAGQLTLAQLP